MTRPIRHIDLGRPERHQAEILYSKAFRRAMIGGVGSGKSWTAVMLALKACIDMPGETIALLNATYPLLRDTTLAEWRRLIPSEAYVYKVAEQKILMRNGSTIYLKSTEKALERIAGWSIAGAIYDEAGLAKNEQAAKMVMERIRSGPEDKRFFAMVTSPRGHPWLQEWCERRDARGRTPHVINATTFDNPYTGALYKELLSEEFPEGTREYEQELLGRFIARTGLLYGDVFRPDHLALIHYDYNRPYYLGWDPGSRASGVVAAQEYSPGLYCIVREWTDDERPTEETARRVMADMGKRPAAVYMDTPSKLNTRTDMNDVLAVQGVFGRGVPIRVLAGRVRSTRFRQTSVRSALTSKRLLISADLVKQQQLADDRGLVRALRTMPWKSESSRDERTDDKDRRKHILDALEFAVVILCPAKYADQEDRAGLLNASQGAA